MSFGYEAFDDPYVYKQSDVLKNKLGLRDPIALAAFELEMTTLRASESLPSADLDPPHYRRLHYHLFQDVYRWAGKYRTIRIGRGENWFCYPEYIEAEMTNLFATIPLVIDSRSEEAFVQETARFLTGLNAIHPFRDGNGRTQLSFLSLLASQSRRRIDLSRVRKDRILPAMIASFRGQIEPLAQEIRALLI